MKTGIIFDMDGLLINSEPFWQRAETAVFSDVGIHLTPEMCRQTMGLRTDEMVKYWYDRQPWSGPSLPEIERAVLSHLSHLIRTEGTPMPGAVELVKQLGSAGIDMAIASSSPLTIIKVVVQMFGWSEVIGVMKSAENQEYGKPHPGVFIETAKAIGYSPAHCLVFEDSINGVIAGKAARMRTIAVPDRSMYDRPEYGIADFKISSLVEFDLRCMEQYLGA